LFTQSGPFFSKKWVGNQRAIVSGIGHKTPDQALEINLSTQQSLSFAEITKNRKKIKKIKKIKKSLKYLIKKSQKITKNHKKIANNRKKIAKSFFALTKFYNMAPRNDQVSVFFFSCLLRDCNQINLLRETQNFSLGNQFDKPVYTSDDL
jgi:hypothetical protein